MFHAALVIAVCVYVDPASRELPSYANDLEVAKAILSTQFPTDGMAIRCLGVLDALNPHNTQTLVNTSPTSLKAQEFIGDFDVWSSAMADESDLFNWPAFGDGFS